MTGPSVPDLRMPVLACWAWAAALLGLLVPAPMVALLLGPPSALLAVWAWRRGSATVLLWLLAGLVVAASSVIRAAGTHAGPVASLAEQHAAVTVVGRVASDPVRRTGRYGTQVLTRIRVDTVSGRGRRTPTRVPVLVVGDASWAGVPLGARIRVTGLLRPADGDLAAYLSGDRPPRVLEPPGMLWRGAAAVRGGVREAVERRPPMQRALVPALVDGDDTGLSDRVAEEFRVSGLTHLLAVSGTNLTLVVGALLVLARWAGVRGRWQVVVGGLGVAGFVLLARTEPSVLRAAAMGSVALVGLGSNGRHRGVRALGVATVLLLLADPWLALSVGFALSASATAGILLLAPPWRDALSRWVPRWMAEAVAVPAAAQLACTPLVAAISGQVSLVAVAANMAAAPVVGVATVAGVAGGLADLVWPVLGHCCGALAGWCAAWILAVAHASAALPGAALGWEVSWWSLTLLTVLCLLVALVARPVLRRPPVVLALGALAALVWLVPTPTPGWPPPGWLLVACDVGQGDGLVLRAGVHEAVVVDTGPDPAPMHECLRRLHVTRIPVVVLTHFHADHVGGLSGVLQGHRVDEVDVTGYPEPSYGAADVRRLTRGSGVPERVPAYGEVHRVGRLTWQVVGPVRLVAGSGSDGDGSAPNNASLVLLVRVNGVRILLPGDAEPESQQLLAGTLPGLHVDVLKVPHHGSRYQDAEFLSGLDARLAVISVGRENDYGHPAPSTVALLRRAGMKVERTDLDGDVAVTLDPSGRLGVATR